MIKNDPVTLAAYSTDASIYQIMPRKVAVPESREELQHLVKEAYGEGLPVIPRGAATGIAGGCIGDGLILDLTSLNRILLMEESHAICEPGVIQNQLNRAASHFGKRLGPDTSTGDRATLGGMAANNAAGAHSLVYGSMIEAVETVEILDAEGNFHTIGKVDTDHPLLELLRPYRDTLITRLPPLNRRAAGYNLDRIWNANPNLAHVIVGSEGTLGIITSLTLKLAPVLPPSQLFTLPFRSLLEALEAVPRLMEAKPFALELIDRHILELGAARHPLPWLKEMPAALLIFESPEPPPLPYLVVTHPHALWEVRKAGLGILMSKQTWSRAVGFIEDIALAPAQLAPFMRRFLPLLKEDAGIYGHAGPGCLHIRPWIDMRDPSQLHDMKILQEKTADLIIEFGGAISGEHGEGLVRSWLNEKLYGPEVVEAFRLTKGYFDPHNRLNPGKIVNAPPLLSHLRLSPDHLFREPETFLHFEKGLALEVDLCNGNGACRKMEGVMCPSFQATRDETTTTRARAQALRAVLQNRLLPNAETDHGVHAILDLCLSCKGCKSECPSQVDMAKMKAEFNYQYQKKYGSSWRDWLFAHFGPLMQWAQPVYFLLNRLRTWNLFKWLGISRPLPLLSATRFSNWFTTYQQPLGTPVVLFVDTYTEFLHPEIGQAAVQVLNKLGFEVIAPSWSCCGRPAFSKGFLELARTQAQKVVEHLKKYQGLPLIGLEPSCILTLADEYRSLLGESLMVHTFEGFLAQHDFTFSASQDVWVHVHCHAKAYEGSAPFLDVLKKGEGFHVHEIPSGCCGMAGSFGYETEHLALSHAIGNLVLIPTIESLPAASVLLSNGFSCRTQIEEMSSRRALHLAEFLNQWI